MEVECINLADIRKQNNFPSDITRQLEHNKVAFKKKSNSSLALPSGTQQPLFIASFPPLLKLQNSEDFAEAIQN